MPKQYTAIRDSLVKRGYTYDEAQAIAAATYNKRHPGAPMRHSNGDKPKAKGKNGNRQAIRKAFL